MANRIYTRGLVLCLSIISCYGFLDDNFGKEDKLGSFGCSGLTAPTNGVKGQLSSNSFSRSKNLTSGYQLKWNFNSTHILLQAHVKVSGWIGLGISERASMYPSDMMVAWVDSKKSTHFTDRHVEAYTRPSVDDHQDWFLVSGGEVDGYTTITALRPLDPCDEQDMPIKSGENWVIYALGETDPTEGKDITYHGFFNRGIHAIDFFGN